jgi:SAM-dependent methyltransferase
LPEGFVPVEKDYVLGTHDDEIARLGLQHAVWRPRATRAWQRAGFTAGHTVLDLGCGPGYAALDLAEIVGPGGRVVAVDRSRRFLDRLEATARGRGLTQIETLERDLDEQSLPQLAADGVWTRWVYAFVRDPKRVLEIAAQALKPGGRMVVHEYVDYRTWRLSPCSAEFEDFVNEVVASWRESGGEPDIGVELPRWLTEMGFDVQSLEPIVEAVRPGDHFWQWPHAFVEVGIRRLVDLGRIDASRALAFTEAFARNAATPGAFQITPMVVEIIAVKR